MLKTKKYPRVHVTPPGPKAKKCLQRDKAVISPSYVRWYPLVVDSGHGAIVRDIDGNEYIDFNAGLAVLALGLSNEKINRVVYNQVRKLIHYSNTDFYYEEAIELAEKLIEMTPGSFNKKVYFGNSGTEAVEAALKMARWHTGRQKFIAFIGAFHGRTYGSLSLTASKPVHRARFSPLLPGVEHVPYPYCYRCPFNLELGDCDYYCVKFIDEWVLERYVPPEEVAAIVFEPIQGEGGCIVPPEVYFKELKKLADKHGILLIDDEVQAGMGRTGKWWAIEHFGVTPDILTSAKALANGLPLGAAIARTEIMNWTGGSHASTFGGNPVACAAAMVVIETIEKEGLLEHALKLGNYIIKRFREMQEKYEIIGDVRGKGLMIGVEIVKDKETKEHAVKEAIKIMNESWKKGVIVILAGKSTIRVSPPLVITKELVDAGLEIIEKEVENVNRELGR